MRIQQILPISDIDVLEVDMKNTGATADEAGDVVVIDTADLNGRSAKKTTTAGNTLVVGIRKSNVLSNDVGSVCVFGSGIDAKVKTDATNAIAIGDVLATSATAGYLAKGTAGGFAAAMEAVAVSTSKKIKVKIL